MILSNTIAWFLVVSTWFSFAILLWTYVNINSLKTKILNNQWPLSLNEVKNALDYIKEQLSFCSRISWCFIFEAFILFNLTENKVLLVSCLFLFVFNLFFLIVITKQSLKVTATRT